MRKLASKKLEALHKQVDGWNLLYPAGTPVIVTKDLGKQVETKTRTGAWVLGRHTAVIMVEGIAGAYSLDRVRPKLGERK